MNLPLPPVPKKNNVFKKLFGKADITGVSPGSKILLKAPQALEDARKLNPKAKGLEATVKNLTRIQESNNLATWTFIEVEAIIGVSDTQMLLLMVKDVDNERLICCYTEDINGSRENLISRDERWLFQAPATDSYAATDLLYTMDFDRQLDGTKNDRFYQKEQGELHGAAMFNPPKSGLQGMVSTIVEFTSDVCVPNSEYLILETGSESGSIINTYWGCPMQLDWVEIK